MTLTCFFQMLPKVRSLELNARFDEERPTVMGKGSVVTSQEGDHVYLFKEQGSWLSFEEKEVSFSNVYRFTLEEGKIALEQLSHGEKHPRFLFYLVGCEDGTLSSMAAHLCNQDTYQVKVIFDQKSIQMHWHILGPKKNQKIQYCYQ